MRDTSGYGFGSPGMPNYILSHSSSFKSAWTWFILILTLYTAWMVPYSVAFQEFNLTSSSPACSEMTSRLNWNKVFRWRKERWPKCFILAHY